MPTTVSADSIDRTITALLSGGLSIEAQETAAARFAEARIREAEAANRGASGRKVTYRLTVDGGVATLPLGRVRLTSTVVADFSWQQEIVDWVWAEVVRASPVKSGRYRESLRIYADGVEHTAPPADAAAEEWVITVTTAYARKIEGYGKKRPPASRNAPKGVFQVVAELAKRRFDNLAAIKFTYFIIDNPATHIGRWAHGATRAPTRRKNTSSKYKRWNAARARERNLRNPAILIAFR